MWGPDYPRTGIGEYCLPGRLIPIRSYYMSARCFTRSLVERGSLHTDLRHLQS